MFVECLCNDGGYLFCSLKLVKKGLISKRNYNFVKFLKSCY